MGLLDNILELTHEFFIDRQTAGGIEDDDVIAFIARLILRHLGEDDWALLWVDFKEVHADFISDGS